MNAVTDVASPFVFTDSAAGKVKELIEEEGNPSLKLRVFVTGGGCSGFQYGFTFDEEVNEDDTTLEKNGVTLLIDPMSYQYLVGAEIDYSEGLEGSLWKATGPSANSPRPPGRPSRTRRNSLLTGRVTTTRRTRVRLMPPTSRLRSPRTSRRTSRVPLDLPELGVRPQPRARRRVLQQHARAGQHVGQPLRHRLELAAGRLRDRPEVAPARRVREPIRSLISVRVSPTYNLKHP